MLANKILHVILAIISFIIIPVQVVTTFVLGILVSLTFGLLLLPLSFVWTIFFFGPLLGLSYIYERMTILRPLISLVGVPLAVIGNIYVALVPSMGEMDSRWSKMLYCQTFPYTYEFHKFYTKKNKMSLNLIEIFERLDPVLKNFVINFIVNFDQKEFTVKE
jgi:hypothetical protein